LQDGDPALIAAAIGDVAGARGMTKIAKDAGVSRESLYRALSGDTRPEFATILTFASPSNRRMRRRLPSRASVPDPAQQLACAQAHSDSDRWPVRQPRLLDQLSRRRR